MQLTGQTRCPVLGAGKNESCRHVGLSHDVFQQRRLTRLFHRKKYLFHGGNRPAVVDLHPDRVIKNIFSQMANFSGHGGGEQQRLPLGGQIF